jgi:hypothetical protein
MDIKIIEDALKDYKRKKSFIETTKARIEVFEKALNSSEQDNWDVFLYASPTERMLSGASSGQGSSVEYTLLRGEKRAERLKQWIKDEQSKIYPLEIEVGQIEGAMEALTKQQKHIIECKYFEEMFWRDIEISFNDTFRQQNYITVSGIRKMNSEALDILAGILKPFYERFKTA